MNETPKRSGYIGQAWLVILLALLYGGALAGVQTTLGPIIELNKRNETYDRIPQLVGIPEPVSDMDKRKITIVERTVADKDGKPQRVYQAMVEGVHKGWVLPASGQGFAERIDLLIGLDPNVSTITGLYVLDQKETPGLGNLIADKAFRDQFAGKRAGAEQPLIVVKAGPTTGNQILALTGATISSESVATIVNRAIADFKEPIQQLKLPPPAASTPDDAPRGRGG